MVLEQDSLILADQKYYSMDSRKTQLNNNVLVVGTSGAGKTRSIVTPNLLQAVGSYVISDPKGNLYRQYRGYLETQGYEVKCLDFVHPERSIGYNPLKYIRSTQDIVKMSNMLVYQRKEGSHSDPFWDESGTILLAAMIAYLLESNLSNKEKTLGSVIRLLCQGRRGNESGGKTVLDRIMEEHHRRKPDSWAYRQYEKASVAADRTFDSILITLTSKLRNFDSTEMNRMLQYDKIKISSIGQKKTALFVVVSDTDRSMDNLANLFFTQAMNELCLYADECCRDNRLPISVRFILDDFATNCKIEEFPRMIASIRSRGISTMLMIQSEAQLEEGYGSDGRTIIGNCDTYIYLGGNDLSTARAVAERCDVPMKKILNMPVGYNWIFRRGQEPSYNKNFDLEQYLLERMISPSKDMEHLRRKETNPYNFGYEL
ncbi:MAG: type IV secretory system conjugative DNA transfer family protein [Lachnospiraceae bacterium]|nr:type IV secretory system conjugative DNA transfer family protein [Lachnospiraceae bacterium]